MRRLLVGAAFAMTACILGTASDAYASSHREAPFVTKNPKVDSTDFYMFRSYETGREQFVTILANYQPFQDAYGGPNYFQLDPEALYEIHIDSNADGVEDLTFQFDFSQNLNPTGTGQTLAVDFADKGGKKTNPVPLINIGGVAIGDNAKLGVLETYDLRVVTGDRRTGSVTNGGTFTKPVDYIGTTSLGSPTAYENYARSFIKDFNVPGCTTKGRVWAGQRREGFAANIGVIFDLLQGGNAAFGGAITGGNTTTGRGRNPANVFDTGLLYNKNVTTLALEVPITCLKGAGTGIIGGWTSASMRQARVLNPGATYTVPTKEGGAWTQVSHLGMPLVNEVVIGLKDKDTFSAVSPKDTVKLADYVTHPTLPAIIESVYGGAGAIAPKSVRADLVAVFGTGVTVTLNDGPGTKLKLTQTNKLAAAGIEGDNTTPEGVYEYLRLNITDGPGNAFLPRTKAQQAGMPDAVRGLGALGCFTADRKVDAASPNCDPVGFPNGRRPGDDVVDIALRVVMGALYADAALAPARDVPFTDVNYNSAEQFDDTFPYLRTPLAGNIGSPTHPSQP